MCVKTGNAGKWTADRCNVLYIIGFVRGTLWLCHHEIYWRIKWWHDADGAGNIIYAVEKTDEIAMDPAAYKW